MLACVFTCVRVWLFFKQHEYHPRENSKKRNLNLHVCLKLHRGYPEIDQGYPDSRPVRYWRRFNNEWFVRGIRGGVLLFACLMVILCRYFWIFVVVDVPILLRVFLTCFDLFLAFSSCVLHVVCRRVWLYSVAHFLVFWHLFSVCFCCVI